MVSLGVRRVGEGGWGGALRPWFLWPHLLLCPIAPGAVSAPGAQAAEQNVVSILVAAQPLAAISWAPLAQQLLPLVTAKAEPAAGQLCVAEPGKPRQRGASTTLSSPAPQPLLFADLLDENCLVMVERPIMDIKTQLPLPIQQKKFGT